MTRTIGLLVVGLALALATAAQAEKNPMSKKVARKHYELGETLYQTSNYTEALEEFKKAYAIEPLPELLFNIARCHEVLLHLEDAVRFYRQFLEKKPETDHRELVEARIATLKRRMRERTPQAPPASAPAATAPRPAAAPPPPPPPPAQRSSWKGPTGWVTLGLGVALLATGATFSALARGKQTDYEEARDGTGTYSELREIEQDGQRMETIGLVTLVAGGVLAAAGGGLLLWDRFGGSERRSVQVVPHVAAGGCGLSGSISF